MKGITFGEYHSYRDLHLILAEKTIGTPSPKTELIDIPGSDGVLDFTEFFGEVKYENRQLSFEFSTLVPQSEFMTLFAMVQNALHGQKMMISLDADPEWYYIGRITVSEWKADRRIGLLTIDCDCEPYKYRVSSQAVNLCGKNLLNLATGMPVPGHESIWAKTGTGFSFNRGSVTGGSFLYFNLPVKKGQRYIFTADMKLTAQTLYVYKDRLYGTAVAVGNPCVFTAEETSRYLFGLYCSSGVTTATFDNVMVREGSEKLSFEAYDATKKEVAAAFSNTRKAAIPTAYVTGDLTVENGHNFATLSPGKNVLPEFAFTKGENTLIFKGNGVAVVEWKEGGL